MMEWTDRHCRYFLRGFSPHVLLYTEMVTSAALTRGDTARLLQFSPDEHPVALQLGGSDAAELARAARLGEDAGYREINLNCGCPSDRVHAGAFGACLMLQPARVADCVAAMRAAVRVPVTVKLRIGVIDATAGSRQPDWREALARFDDADRERLHGFVAGLVAAGAQALIVHARKAVLGAFSPKDNREVPPLRYDIVHELRASMPGAPVVLNGGLREAPATLAELHRCDGVMLGREAYHRPQVLGELHRALVDEGVWPRDGFEPPTPLQALERMIDYAARELERGERLAAITRHMLGLLSHQPGVRDFRRLLSEGARDAGAGLAPLLAARDHVAALARA
jgi:tRNA-dihydrouridine synthase A